jgi:hypothetical protein
MQIVKEKGQKKQRFVHETLQRKTNDQTALSGTKKKRQMLRLETNSINYLIKQYSQIKINVYIVD